MNKDSLITQSKFDRMLEWLDPDRERAGNKHEQIRRRLIEILASRGCHEPEQWADETITRVVLKIDEVVKNFEGDPAHFFYGVAKNVFREYIKVKPLAFCPPAPAPPDEVEREHACLEHCLARLDEEDRGLILGYYSKERREKIDNRNEMARRLGVAANALRIRVYRIRIGLKECIRDCLGVEAR
ncbi:MAG: hypothetical protein LC802_07820 [Acidobacteria bacterium]|nr:hypothetical protein [Acidobacteriota bacterium]